MKKTNAFFLHFLHLDQYCKTKFCPIGWCSGFFLSHNWFNKYGNVKCWISNRLVLPSGGVTSGGSATNRATPSSFNVITVEHTRWLNEDEDDIYQWRRTVTRMTYRQGSPPSPQNLRKWTCRSHHRGPPSGPCSVAACVPPLHRNNMMYSFDQIFTGFFCVSVPTQPADSQVSFFSFSTTTTFGPLLTGREGTCQVGWSWIRRLYYF